MWLWLSIAGLTLIAMVQAQQLRELGREIRILRTRVDFQGQFLGENDKEAGNGAASGS